jgi:peptidoglycan hydrolase CwlO-like protein
MPEFSFLSFVAAGFNEALKPIFNNDQKILKSIEELKMALLDKLKELESKTDSLVGVVNTEKSEVASKLTELGTEIESLKQAIADLQASLDASNSEQAALSELVDQQISKVDAAAIEIAGIIS